MATNPVLESKFQVVLQSEGGTQPPSLALEPVTKTKKLLTITSWTSSFMIFFGVYTSQFPSEAPALMKYGEIVQDLASRDTTGIIMMRISVIYAKINRQLFLGA